MPEPPTPSEREEKVIAAATTWINRLIDTSRRNNLLYFRELKVGTLDLGDADPEALAELLADKTKRVSQLFESDSWVQISAKLKTFSRTAQANLDKALAHP